jgi:hypothetical protein
MAYLLSYGLIDENKGEMVTLLCLLEGELDTPCEFETIPFAGGCYSFSAFGIVSRTEV